jgi:hypothetical protein
MSAGSLTPNTKTWIRRLDVSLRSRVHPLVRWNVAPLYPHMRSANVFVVSVPKCGRSWLRAFLAAYDGFARGSLPARDLEATERALGVLFAHDRWEHAAAPWRVLALGGCLIPEERRRRAKVVLLARDPRDAVVSLYFQLSRRSGWFTGPLEEMLRHPLFGVRALVDVMNGWAGEWRGRQPLLVRYEDLVENPQARFRDFLRFAFGAVDDDPLRRATEFCSFPRLQELELEGYFTSDVLRSAPADDPESRKVRRGKIGGFHDYLSGTSLEFVNREVARLEPWFGYAV